MAQQQHAADVHPDESYPPNKRYDLMDANKKVDFEQVQYLYTIFQDDESIEEYLQFSRNKNSHSRLSLLRERIRTPSAPGICLTITTCSNAISKKADEMILQDTIQVSLAEHKSHEEQEARENVALVYEHFAAEEIEKLVEDPENVYDSSPPRI
ncbi:hypothetical protein Tco_0835275 [Tanacetum coccineum]